MKKVLFLICLFACAIQSTQAQTNRSSHYETANFIGESYFVRINYNEPEGRLISEIHFIKDPSPESLVPFYKEDTAKGTRMVQLLLIRAKEGAVTRTEAFASMQRDGLAPANCKQLLWFIRNTEIIKPQIGMIALNAQNPYQGVMFFTDGRWLRLHVSTSAMRWHGYFLAVKRP